MKKRLLGFLSLALCLMMAAMPVVGMAVSYNDTTYTANNTYVSAGDLIVPGTSIAFAAAKAIQYGTETPVSIEDSAQLKQKTTGGYWRALGQGKSSTFAFEDVGYPLIIDFVGEKYLLGFEAKLSGFDSSGNPYDHSVIAKDFKAFIQKDREEIGDADKFKYVYYDIGIYEPVEVELKDVDADNPKLQLAYRHVYPAQGSFEFEVPDVPGSDPAVLHWTSGGVEKFAYNDALANASNGWRFENGKIKIKASSLSPFAVAYIPNDDGSTGGNDDNTGGSNDGTSGGGTTGGVEPGYEVPASSASVPQTGDNAQLMLWCALAALSLTAVGVLGAKRRKRA